MQSAGTLGQSSASESRSGPGSLHDAVSSALSGYKGPTTFIQLSGCLSSTLATETISASPVSTCSGKLDYDPYSLEPTQQSGSISQQATKEQSEPETAPSFEGKPFASPPFKLLTPSVHQLKPGRWDSLRLRCALSLLSHACSSGGCSVEIERGVFGSSQAAEETSMCSLSTTVSAASSAPFPAPQQCVSNTNRNCSSSCTWESAAAHVAINGVKPRDPDPVEFANSSALYRPQPPHVHCLLSLEPVHGVCQTVRQEKQRRPVSAMASCCSAADMETNLKQYAAGTRSEAGGAGGSQDLPESHGIIRMYSGKFTETGEFILDANR
jgi:hypothetical protein